MAQVLEAGAQGVGLFRTEFLFLNRQDLPDEEEQFAAYREVAQAMQGRPVVLRTLDIGADKALNGNGMAATPCPTRRWGCARSASASPSRRCSSRSCAPSCAPRTTARCGSCCRCSRTCTRSSRRSPSSARRSSSSTRRAQPYDRKVEIGGMIEIPAAALALPIFMKRLDFLSIGTNDLIQYTLAIDRTDDAVAHLYDPLHPAVLTLVAGTIQTATRGGTPVAVCGEMAGDLQLTRLLLGLGLRNFSMHPSQLLAIKERILRTNLAEVQTLAQRVLRASDPAKTRELLAKLNS